MLKGHVGMKVRELIRQTCESFQIVVMKEVINQDHVHIFGFCASQSGTERKYEAD